MTKIFRLGAILAAFCVVSAGGLAYVYMFTQPKIESNANTAFEKSLREVLPEAKSFKEMKYYNQKIFLGLKGKETVGAALPISARGYAGSIEMLVGIDAKGFVKGVKILSQRETPGLGANVVEPKFLKQFIGKSAKDALEPKKDIDAITGATISSRGVSNGVRQAIKNGMDGMR